MKHVCFSKKRKNSSKRKLGIRVSVSARVSACERISTKVALKLPSSLADDVGLHCVEELP